MTEISGGPTGPGTENGGESTGPNTENRANAIDRRMLWLGIAGAIGAVIAIVALIIAISAQNATSNDAKVTADVSRAARTAVAGVDAQLRRDSATATSVLHQLQAEAAAARRSRDQLLREVGRNQTAAARNATDIAALQKQVSTLNSEVQKLTTTVSKLSTSQTSLEQRVAALEKKVKP